MAILHAFDVCPETDHKACHCKDCYCQSCCDKYFDDLLAKHVCDPYASNCWCYTI